MFTRCRNRFTGGEADLATGALEMWATLGWKPVKDSPPARGNKTDPKSEGEPAVTENKE